MKLSLEEGLTPALVDILHAGVLAMGREAGLNPGVAPVAALVVEEICTNIMEHSNATWLEVALARRGGQAWIRVVDDGLPFNPCKAIRALGGPDLHGGLDRRLGLHIIRQFSNAMRCGRDAAGHNRMEFELRSGSLAQKDD